MNDTTTADDYGLGFETALTEYRSVLAELVHVQGQLNRLLAAKDEAGKQLDYARSRISARECDEIAGRIEETNP